MDAGKSAVEIVETNTALAAENHPYPSGSSFFHQKYKRGAWLRFFPDWDIGGGGWVLD